MPTFYEFFAGGGMVRAGLGDGWKCLFANDFDSRKVDTYKRNWGADEILCSDIRNVDIKKVTGTPDLVWGSFPCQDLSLAGGGAGLRGDRSGTFWPFMKIIEGLRSDGRAPRIVALENVIGTLTSHGGADFSAICNELDQRGYDFGALVIDAARFVPQSRPRLFIIAVDRGTLVSSISSSIPSKIWHTRALCRAYNGLPAHLKNKWIWWKLATPLEREKDFIDIIEDNPVGVTWHSPIETKNLIGMMSDVNKGKLRRAQESKKKMVGGVYRRTRYVNGVKAQRAEVRFDSISGCLRTPAGGSSRQFILLVDGNSVRSRLLSPREAARLMGLEDSYGLPVNYNEAYHLVGDGVAVPVVRYVREHLFDKIINLGSNIGSIAAE